MQQSNDVFLALLRGFWIILLGLVLGAGLGAFVSSFVAPTYQASAYVLVVPASEGDTEAPAPQNVNPEDYTQAYSELVTVPEIVEEAVLEEGGGIVDPQEVEEVVSVEVSPNNPLFTITANSLTPEDASALANSLGSAVSTYTEGLSVDTGYRADLVAEAPVPSSPTLPNWLLNITIGGAVGLLLGGIAALLWDDLVRTSRGLGEQREARRLTRQARQIEKLEKTLERLRASGTQDLQQGAPREEARLNGAAAGEQPGTAVRSQQGMSPEEGRLDGANDQPPGRTTDQHQRES